MIREIPERAPRMTRKELGEHRRAVIERRNARRRAFEADQRRQQIKLVTLNGEAV